jgi:hypothetical protein
MRKKEIKRGKRGLQGRPSEILQGYDARIS